MATFRTYMHIKDAMVPPSKHRNGVGSTSQQRGREAVDEGALQPRLRSLSGGRSHGRSNDLIQGVYDRLGVDRGSTWSKAPTNSQASNDDVDPILGSSSTLENNSNTSSNSTGGNNGRPTFERSSSFRDRQKISVQQSQPNGRGRSDEITSTDESRSRSLSRGRVASRWPPARDEATGTETSNIPVPDTSKKPAWRGLGGSSTHNVKSSYAQGSKSPKTASSNRLSPTQPSPTRLNPAKSPKQIPTNMVLPSLDTEESFPKEEVEESGIADDTKEGFASVRERMRRYSGHGAKATGPRHLRRDSKQYAANLSARQFPPKVNIYASKKEHIDHSTSENDLGIADEKKDDDAGTEFEVATATKFSSVQSRASTYAKSHNFASGTDISVGNSRYKAANKVSNSYISSLQPSPKPQPKASAFNAPAGVSQNKVNSFAAPVTEISTQLQDTGNDNDAISIAMSSVSGDDHVQPTTPSTKRTIWQNERNRVKAIAPAPAALDTALVNKMIDDRVQAHIADMETRLGAQMRRFMQQMDDKILERLEKMEAKLRDLQDAVEAKRTLGRLGQPMQGVRL